MAIERILGLDLGTASVGFALIDYDRLNHEGKIVRMGVRIFPETLDAKTRVPLNQQRRAKRLVRRQVRRRKQRRRDLNEYLNLQGLLPVYGTPAWDEVMKLDPYRLRLTGLRNKLENYELGRAIYHLSKRRHFLGRDGDSLNIAEDNVLDGTSDADDAQTNADRQALLNVLQRKELTLGEYLATLEPGERKRNKVASRNAVREELNRLIEHQAAYERDKGPDIVAVGKQITEIIFHQKPTFWRLNTLGTCPFFPNSPICKSGSWIAYQRKLLEFVNNISIAGNNEPLSQRARDGLISACSEKDELSWKDARKVLRPVFEEEGYDLDYVKFNMEISGERKLPGNPVERKLKQIFGKSWRSHPAKQSIRESIHEDIFKCDYEQIGKQRIAILREDARKSNRKGLSLTLIKQYNVTYEEAEELSKLSFKAGWERYSVEAINCFIDKLKDGHRMGDLLNSPNFERWRQDTFPNVSYVEDKPFDQLPSPKYRNEQERLNQIKNPTVVRTLNELRKVVNNLIRAYGRPDLIRVELVRDLRNSKKKRQEIEDINKRNEKQRKDAVASLKECNLENPSRRDIDKWLLWQECGQLCPYTGSTISFNALFGSNPSFEIEHIWPRSRSFDDGFLNKSLCLSSENRIKNNRTPYEYMHSDEDKWFHLTKRLEDMQKSHGMDPRKVRRFLQKEIPDGFTERQLRDTSYAAKEAISTLERLWKPTEINQTKRVQAVSGQATAKIRRLWGLDGVLGDEEVKTRDDHRHHAIDALAVACIYPGAISALLRDYYEGEESYRPRPLEKPWSSIRTDARKHTEKIVVSHKVQRKVSGALHEETIYSKTLNEVKQNGTVKGQFVVRKSIDGLTKKQISGIRDNHIKSIIENSTSSSSEAVQIGAKKRTVKKVKVAIDRDVSLMQEIANGYAELGRNHHMAVFMNSFDNVEFRVVSLFEVTTRLRKKLPIVDKSLSGCKFLFSLSINEAIKINEGIWIVTQVKNNGQLVLVDVNDAREVSKRKKWSPMIKTLIRLDCNKVSIDPIGNIRVAND